MTPSPPFGRHAQWLGVAVICGSGMNAVGRAPDGRVARFSGLGDIAGDRGGGSGLGMWGLGAAVRADDGRGQATSLSTLVPAHFGLGTPADVTEALYLDRIKGRRVGELAPVVAQAARDGDAVARAWSTTSPTSSRRSRRPRSGASASRRSPSRSRSRGGSPVARPTCSCRA